MSCICQWMGCSTGEPSGPKTTITFYSKRSCTDLPCTLLFALFIGVVAAVIYIPAYQKSNGDVIDTTMSLVLPSDYAGKRCEGDTPVAYWPYLDIINTDDWARFKLCASSCDVTRQLARTTSIGPYASREVFGLCIPQECPDRMDASAIIGGVAQNVCTDDWVSKMEGVIKGMSSEYVQGVYNARWVILSAVGIALVACFVYISLLKCMLAPIIYGSIAIIIAGLFFLAYWLLDLSSKMTEPEKDETDWKKYTQWAAYGVAVLDAVFALVICCLRNRIKIAVEVVKSTSRSFEDIPLIPFFPLIPFILSVLCVAGWTCASMFLLATSDMKTKYVPDSIRGVDLPGYGVIYSDAASKIPYQVRDYDSTLTFNTFAPHLMLLFWCLAICNYFGYAVIAGAVADWYFTPRDQKSGRKLRNSKYSADYNDDIHLTNTPILDAVLRTLRFHVGTIIFAAAIIAVVRTARAILLYVIKTFDGGLKPNKIQLMLQGFVQCLLKVLDCILDKINKNALVYTAIYGDAFCPSACGSFALVMSNVIRAAFISLVERIVSFLGELMVSIVTAAICAAWLLLEKDMEFNAKTMVLPLVITFFIAYVISKLFLSVFDIGVDTIFVCFLVDEKQNKENGCMLADPGLKHTVTTYEKEASEHAKGARFRYQKEQQRKRTMASFDAGTAV